MSARAPLAVVVDTKVWGYGSAPGILATSEVCPVFITHILECSLREAEPSWACHT